MSSNTLRTRSHTRLVRALLVLLGLGASTGFTTLACKKQSKKDSEAKAVPSASSSAAPASTLADRIVPGPCGELQTKFCNEAGQESALCASAVHAVGMLSDAACSAALKDFQHTAQKIKSERKVCDDLVKKLCDGVGPETETCKMVTEKTQQFPTDRCTSMLPQADEIIADLKRQELANRPLDAAMQSKIGGKDAPSFGPENAKVTVVEFSDFQCPYCSRAASVMTQLKAKYGDRVRFVFRQFPLSFHENAGPAAEASLAAHAQGKFWEYHDKLFANQRHLDGHALEEYAKDSGLDVEKFKAAMASKEFAATVKSDLEMGESVAVQGTPTMFVNGERVPNPTDESSVSQLIEKALSGG